MREGSAAAHRCGCRYKRVNACFSHRTHKAWERRSDCCVCGSRTPDLCSGPVVVDVAAVDSTHTQIIMPNDEANRAGPENDNCQKLRQLYGFIICFSFWVSVQTSERVCRRARPFHVAHNIRVLLAAGAHGACAHILAGVNALARRRAYSVDLCTHRDCDVP